MHRGVGDDQSVLRNEAGPAEPPVYADRFPLLESDEFDSDPHSFQSRLQSRISRMSERTSFVAGDAPSPAGITGVERGVERLGAENWSSSIGVEWSQATVAPMLDAQVRGSVQDPLDLASVQGPASGSQTVCVSVQSVGFGRADVCLPVEVVDTAYLLVQRLVGEDAVVARAMTLSSVMNPKPYTLNPKPQTLNPKP